MDRPTLTFHPPKNDARFPVSPRYNRYAGLSGSSIIPSEPDAGWDEHALDDAAEALRQTELEAVHVDVAAPELPRLDDTPSGNA